MQRFLGRSSHSLLMRCGHRYLATTPVEEVLFPTKSDFPSRHIGPRKTDVVAMLDTLGYKVRPDYNVIISSKRIFVV